MPPVTEHARHQRILDAFFQLPEEIRRQPATEQELDAFETAFGELPADYRWFLRTCGGGAVGREWLDGIQQLWRSQAKYEKELGPPAGWSMERVVVIGWDGFGNPLAIHKPTGRVLVEDHNFGGIHEVAPSFLAYLEMLLFA